MKTAAERRFISALHDYVKNIVRADLVHAGRAFVGSDTAADGLEARLLKHLAAVIKPDVWDERYEEHKLNCEPCRVIDDPGYLGPTRARPKPPARCERGQVILKALMRARAGLR